MAYHAKFSMLGWLLLTLTVGLGADWLHFRGNDQRAIAPAGTLPLEWKLGDAAGAGAQNVAWTVELPGRGVSSPIVVGHRVVATSASGALQDRLHVHVFDAATGKLLWQRTFWATGRTFCHPTSSVAACTPTSDGQRIYAFYSSNDLFCLDLDGNLLWARGLTHDFPTAANDVGMSSSPLVVDGTVIVQIENKGESFAAGLDASTGETRWKIGRKADMNWTSPTLLPGPGGAGSVVLLQSTDKLTAHEPASGKLLWTLDKECKGIPTVTTTADGLAFVPSGGITALEPTDSASPRVLWSESKLDPGTPSPVVHAGKIYVINSSGALTAADTKTGEVLWRLRLKGQFWATPILVGDHLLTINRDGLAQTVKLGEAGEVVAESPFGETVVATPAVADGGMFVRGDRHLWKIARP